MFKRKRLIAFFSFLIVVIFLLAAFIRQQYVVPILMYHSVNPDAAPENRLTVSVITFERQMEFLRKHRYNILPLEALADLVKENRKIPARTIAITFDDGYRDNYTYAFPVLKKYGFAATIFLIVDEIGKPDRLSWNEIKQMRDSGVITFGSHSLGPEPLINIKSKQELKRQIFESKKILEEKLGRKAVLFSYPEGRFNDEIKELVKDAGYKAAVVTSPGKKFAGDDIFALKRLRISATSDNLFVFWIETSGYYTFIKEHRDED